MTPDAPPEPAADTPDGQVKIRLAPTYIGNVSPGSVSTGYARSLHELRVADVENGWRTVMGVVEATSGAQISRSRNDIVREFLRLSEQDGAEWLLMIDSDMVFPVDLIPRLQLAAHVSGAKAVGGLCVTVDPNGPPRPTLFRYDTVPGSAAFTRVMLDYPEDALIEVAATGTACLMVHRDALLDLRRQYGHDFAWFDEQVHRVERWGKVEHHWASEDIEFCHRLREAGHRVVVDTTLKIGHQKHGRVWTADDIATWTGARRPPIVAVIPYKGRIAMTDCLADDLLACRVDDVVLVNNGAADEIPDVAGEDPRVTVMHRPDAGIHEMWNAGAEFALAKHGPRAHVAFLNNDIKVCPDFLPLLSSALVEHPEYMVVGGNYDDRPQLTVASSSPVVPVDDICAGRYDGTGGLPGFAFMVAGGVFSGGYRFPTAMKWWYGDNDLILTLRRTRAERRQPDRWLAGIVLAAACRHVERDDGTVGSVTAGDWSSDEWRDQLAADRVAFLAKWEGQSGEPAAATSALAAGDYDAALAHLAATPSDIHEHLHTLRDLAVDMGARTIVELGVRAGVSTVAWLSAIARTGGHLHAVDIAPVPAHVSAAAAAGLVTVHRARSDDRDLPLAALADDIGCDADIVFIDTNHDYALTLAELELWAPHVRDGGRIVLHDTAVRRFPHHDEQGLAAQPPYPVRAAVDVWLSAAPITWRIESQTDACNGLTVLHNDAPPFAGGEDPPPAE